MLADFALYPNDPTATTSRIRSLSVGFNAGKSVNPANFRGFTGRNTFVGNFAGERAGQSNYYFSDSTFVGDFAGQNLIYGGNRNVIVGGQAWAAAAYGDDNTALGFSSLRNGFSSHKNTAVGSFALGNNGGTNNVAVGFKAAYYSTTAGSSVAVGSYALLHNQNAGNIAVGRSALRGFAGGYGIGIGNYAGPGSGGQVIAIGAHSMTNAFLASKSIALGDFAMFGAGGSSTITNNIAIGYKSGFSINATGISNNIIIGNYGASTDSNTIRIGSPTGSLGPVHTKCFIAGIEGNQGAGFTDTVVINPATSQLGVLASSHRFKEDIVNMPDQTDKIMNLRPVNFHFKSDEAKKTQYGLIAEEVDALYPELVSRDASGEIYSVNYQGLIPVLVAKFGNLKMKWHL